MSPHAPIHTHVCDSAGDPEWFPCAEGPACVKGIQEPAEVRALTHYHVYHIVYIQFARVCVCVHVCMCVCGGCVVVFLGNPCC